MFRIDFDFCDILSNCTSTTHSASRQTPTHVKSVSADECARLDYLFEDAAQKNKFRFESEVAESPLIDKIREELVFPPGILSQEFFDYCDIYRRSQWKRPFPLPQEWLFPLWKYHYALEYLATGLYGCWKTYKEYVTSTKTRPFDVYYVMAKMLLLLSTAHSGTGPRFPPPPDETDFVLPAQPYTVHVPVSTLIRLPQEWREYLGRMDNSYVFSPQLNIPVTNLYVLPWCVNLSDNKDSSRQIAFSLCSVQNQFRALGFRDIRAYGVTLFKYELRFYVSEWVGDEVVVKPTKHVLDLSSFSDYLHLYAIIYKLIEDSLSQVDRMVAKWERDGISKEATACPWRPPPPKVHEDEDEIMKMIEMLKAGTRTRLILLYISFLHYQSLKNSCKDSKYMEQNLRSEATKFDKLNVLHAV